MNETLLPEDKTQSGVDFSSLKHPVVRGNPSLLNSYIALHVLGGLVRWCQDVLCRPTGGGQRAAEWILDNDYQIIRAIRHLNEGLPRPFYEKFPATAGPDGPAHPRVFALAQAILDRLEPQITLTWLVSSVVRYQTSAELTNAELWAVASILRLACLERFIDAVGALDPALMPSVS